MLSLRQSIRRSIRRSIDCPIVFLMTAPMPAEAVIWMGLCPSAFSERPICTGGVTAIGYLSSLSAVRNMFDDADHPAVWAVGQSQFVIYVWQVKLVPRPAGCQVPTPPNPHK